MSVFGATLHKGTLSLAVTAALYDGDKGCRLCFSQVRGDSCAGERGDQCPAPQTLASGEELGAAGPQQPLSTVPSACAGQITPQLLSQPEGALKATSAW